MRFRELGGGRSLQKLLEIPVAGEKMNSAMFIVVLDLSRPHRALADVQYWINVIRTLVGKFQQSHPDLYKLLLVQAAQDDVYAGHADRSRIMSIPVPVLIVANKLDVFQNASQEQLKAMAATLRYHAHMNGASLMYSSKSQKPLLQSFRTRISRHLLNKSNGKSSQIDPLKPIIVPAGTDSLAAIGNPLNAQEFARLFPFDPSDKEDEVLQELKLTPEPLVDMMLATKSDDLKLAQREGALRRNLRVAEEAAADMSEIEVNGGGRNA